MIMEGHLTEHVESRDCIWGVWRETANFTHPCEGMRVIQERSLYKERQMFSRTLSHVGCKTI
jgi:hypothetical protein